MFYKPPRSEFMFVDVLINVLAIIGIIIAGGFLIFFLGDLVISIVDGKNSTIFESRKNRSSQNDYSHTVQRQEPNNIQQQNASQQHTVSPYYSVKEEAKTGTLEFGSGKTDNNLYESKGWKEVDEEQARIERMMLENSNKPQEQVAIAENNTSKNTTTELSAIDQLRKEEEEFKKKRLEEAKNQSTKIFPTQTSTSKSISQTKSDEVLDFGDLFFDDSNSNDSDEDDVDFEALLAELTSKSEQNTPSKEEELFLERQADEEDNLNAFLKEEDEEYEEEQTEQTSDELIEQTEEESDFDGEEQTEEEPDVRDELRIELENLKQILQEKEQENIELKQKTEKELEQTKADLQALKAELEQVRQTQVVSDSEDALLSEDEYLALIERLTVRLKANEKELKAVKREYLPLARVKKSLDNDKRKLRRKEATVAKQKVMLYGVNNYVDIDEEKAKQLAEDLDLLDGLKLSVEHCESVMEQNKERFPLLENTYRILKEANEALKKDIAELNEQVEKIKANANNS